MSDAVKHLTDANMRLTTLNREHQLKTDECNRQKEEITRLLAQVGNSVSPQCLTKTLSPFFAIGHFEIQGK